MKNLEQKLADHLGIEVDDNFDYENLLEENDLVYDELDDEFINVDDAVYCEIEGIFTHESNTFYCEFSEYYFTTIDYFPMSVIGVRNKHSISSYYDDNLSVFDLAVCEEDRKIYSIDELFYWDSDGLYHSTPYEEEEEEDGLFEYHHSNPDFLANIDSVKIGFEIEKEDINERKGIRASDIQNTYGWGVERDGSLDSDTGFELVSPIFDLHKPIDYFEDQFNKVDNLINANYSKSCGGHINYSHPDYYPSENLLNSISGYIPLLYSLYEHRLGISYCVQKTKDRLISEREKYQSIRLKSNGIVEFRIFPAVKNIKNLLWRIELIKIIDTYKTSSFLTVADSMLDTNSALHKLLTKIFSFEKIAEKVRLVLKYGQYFEEVEVSQSTLKTIEEKINKLNNLNK
jgi:hypothetical protein